MDPHQSPFDALGGELVVLKIAEAFYDAMDADEPTLAALHETDEHGHVSKKIRHDFGRFLVFWTGGPGDYLQSRGHPRLGMRHAHLAIGPEMRDAWLRCMTQALDKNGVSGEVRELLDARFRHVAHFLQNRPDVPTGEVR
jgi:hemoglobin